MLWFADLRNFFLNRPRCRKYQYKSMKVSGLWMRTLTWNRIPIKRICWIVSTASH